MQIKYKNSDKDIFDFYKYSNKGLKELKYYKMAVRFASIPICALIYIIIGLPSIMLNRGMDKENTNLLTIVILIAIVWIVLYSIIDKLSTDSNIKKEIKWLDISHNNEITLNIEDDGITVSTSEDKSKYLWSGINDIIEVNNSLYIIVKNNKSIIIPKNAVDNFNELLEEINKRR